MTDDGLVFPWPEPPAIGDCREVAPGVHWLRMGLPLALDHINLYLLDAGNGWYVLDTGMNTDGSRETWERVMATCLGGRPVIGVIVTHMHPDHVGLAGWLCERFRAPLLMSFGEYFSARCFSTPPKTLAWSTEAFFRRAGMSDDYIGGFRRRVRGYGSLVAELPGSYRRLRDGDLLPIGSRYWRVVVGSGHSPEHVCLHCEADGLLLAGDQVIAGITSNVSVMAIEPDANPLACWLDSHRRFLQLPADVLVLPAHNLPFRGLHRRLQALIDHHEDHMRALEAACVQPQSLPELLPVLFRRPLGDNERSMAVGECLAHLHLLMARGRIARDLDGDGVLYLYRTVAHDPATASAHHQRDDGPSLV